MLICFIEIPGPTKVYILPDEEDYNEQLGSADKDEDDESNSVLERGRTVSSISPSSPLDTRHNHVPADPVPNTASVTSSACFYFLLIFFSI